MKILPGNEKLNYCGRIDFANQDKPIFVYPCSYVEIKFEGTYLYAYVQNHNLYWDNYLGIIVDGKQTKVLLENDENKIQKIILAEDLEYGIHQVTLFKRQDACHIFAFLGFEASDDSILYQLDVDTSRRIEFYGDSISAGEVSEAVEYAGAADPDFHNGEFSNSYFSYAWITARKLGARIHDIAQGGIALLDNTGWFNEPDYIGMESVYDKIQYNEALSNISSWDFSRFSPQVVVVAIGQNDNHPKDYMAEDYDSAMSKNWRNHYQKFIKNIRSKYPKALIILKTTVMFHHENWDRAIKDVCEELNDSKIMYFRYSKNGAVTPGHIRIPEAEQMATELVEYINSFGEEIWW